MGCVLLVAVGGGLVSVVGVVGGFDGLDGVAGHVVCLGWRCGFGMFCGCRLEVRGGNGLDDD
jgi:hypothetical protein